MSEDPGEPGAGDGERDADDDRDAPLSELADRVRRSRADRDADPVADLMDDEGRDSVTDAPATDEAPREDPFEAMDVETVDEESVWESLESEDPEVTDQPEVGAGGDAERVDPEDSHGNLPEHVVPKAAYCQRCRFLSDPPDVRCTHDGTAIVEVVDSERFRVRACPMVDRGEAGSVDRG